MSKDSCDGLVGFDTEIAGVSFAEISRQDEMVICWVVL
jgi:hypothetical protein